MQPGQFKLHPWNQTTARRPGPRTRQSAFQRATRSSSSAVPSPTHLKTLVAWPASPQVRIGLPEGAVNLGTSAGCIPVSATTRGQALQTSIFAEERPATWLIVRRRRLKFEVPDPVALLESPCRMTRLPASQNRASAGRRESGRRVSGLGCRVGPADQHQAAGITPGAPKAHDIGTANTPAQAHRNAATNLRRSHPA